MWLTLKISGGEVVRLNCLVSPCLDHGYADGKYDATVKNARTESKRESIGAGTVWRLDFLIAHTTSQISDPNALTAVRRRNAGQISTQVDQAFIREVLPALN